MLAWPLFCQEADTLGRNAEVVVITRLECNPSFTTGEKPGYDLGLSSFYTNFDIPLSPHVDFFMSNHWVASGIPSSRFGEATADLYRHSFRSDESDWLDFFYFDFHFDNWSFRIGKETMYMGGFEFDPYDYECHLPLLSTFWNDMSAYQWGGSVTYTTPSEMTSFSLKASTSPYGEYPFASGLFAAGAQVTGDYGPFSGIWSVTGMDRGDGGWQWVVSLGQQLALGEDWTLGLHYQNAVGGCTKAEQDTCCEYGHTAYATVNYAPFDWLDIDAKCVYEYSQWYESVLAGAALNFYPLTDSQDLRLHLAGAYDTFFKTVTVSVGALWQFHIPFLKNRR
ncbi:MAG: hypothetical protein J5871_00885 [Bacteroidales bacterium]|nr:hypothetical protein [Bacteroidales bacterium]